MRLRERGRGGRETRGIYLIVSLECSGVFVCCFDKPRSTRVCLHNLDVHRVIYCVLRVAVHVLYFLVVYVFCKFCMIGFFLEAFFFFVGSIYGKLVCMARFFASARCCTYICVRGCHRNSFNLMFYLLPTCVFTVI